MDKKERLNEARLKKALIKRALGYDCNETTEEYVFDDSGKAVLNKKKITKKHYSPDISAAKILISQYGQKSMSEIELMSDEELKEERNRLIKLLQGGNDE